jgi:hypothetical protein
MGTWFGVDPHAPRNNPVIAMTTRYRKDPIRHSLPFQKLLLKDVFGPTWVPNPHSGGSIFFAVYLHITIVILERRYGKG